MRDKNQPMLSVVVPVYNEASGLIEFQKNLARCLGQLKNLDYEIIYCDDGSHDRTTDQIKHFREVDSQIKLIRLSRNFGKEVATTAGINTASGRAIITIDSDGQHPVELIPQFVEKWQAGAKVIIGVRTGNQKEGLIKRLGSKIFYKVINKLSGVKLVPNSSDFRLIDRSVQQEFNRMTERGRITRGLIDWLGYKREFIEFKANPRIAGSATYSFSKLIKLFIDSVVSMSKSPLYLSAYIGAVVLPLSILLGLFMLVNSVIGDPINLNATGSAYLVVLLMFLIGVLLVSQGIIGLYLSHIHTETQNRPLYIIDYEESEGVRQI
jgi:glycosyltransferase involved in cell wall biosynthesis